MKTIIIRLVGFLIYAPLLLDGRRLTKAEILLERGDRKQNIDNNNNVETNGEGNKLDKTDGNILRSLESKKSRPQSLDDHLVKNLPYLKNEDFPTKHYAGHLSASDDNDDKRIFYWLLEPEIKEDSNLAEEDIPLLIWLNGGPGCSSMDGLWLELGPFRLKPNNERRMNSNSNNQNDEPKWKIHINPHSWHKAPAWVLFIDQPVGTGLSYTAKGNYCKNDLEVNTDFHYFLRNFLYLYRDIFLTVVNENNPKEKHWKVNRPFFFSGESHAGHYIPSMMDFILKKNDEVQPFSFDEKDKTYDGPPPDIHIPLSGALIGNGWIDPYHQYAGATYAYAQGWVNLAQKAALDDVEKDCQQLLEKGKLRSGTCLNLIDDIVAYSAGSRGSSVSYYDNQVWDRSIKYPPGSNDVEAYLGGKHSNPPMDDMEYIDVLKAIHASETTEHNHKYTECANKPSSALSHQDGLGVVQELVRVLDHPTKPRMLFFNGMRDLMCNHVGNERVLNNLPWSKAKKWVESNRYVWNPDIGYHENYYKDEGRTAGFMKRFENLGYLTITNAGHMVPMDQPKLSMALITSFLHENSFETYPQDNIDGIFPDELVQCSECPDPCQGMTKKIISIDDVSHHKNMLQKLNHTNTHTANVDKGVILKREVIGLFVGGGVGACLFFVYMKTKGRYSETEHTELSTEDENDFEIN